MITLIWFLLCLLPWKMPYDLTGKELHNCLPLANVVTANPILTTQEDVMIHWRFYSGMHKPNSVLWVHVFFSDTSNWPSVAAIFRQSSQSEQNKKFWEITKIIKLHNYIIPITYFYTPILESFSIVSPPSLLSYSIGNHICIVTFKTFSPSELNNTCFIAY